MYTALACLQYSQQAFINTAATAAAEAITPSSHVGGSGVGG